MTELKKVIEIALNDGYTVPRFEVERVEIINNICNVYYIDKLKSSNEVCQFSI